MGPIEQTLRHAVAAWPHWELVIQRIAPHYDARTVVYGAAAYLTGHEALGLAHMVTLGVLPDVLTEALCAAEALGL